jgi:hypothetical protein
LTAGQLQRPEGNIEPPRKRPRRPLRGQTQAVIADMLGCFARNGWTI